MILAHMKLDGAASAVRHVFIIAYRILVYLIYGEIQLVLTGSVEPGLRISLSQGTGR